jgi:hypothetical protein
MSDIQKLRLARLESIQRAGALRFILSRGLAFGVLFGAMVMLSSPPPLAWYALLGLFLVAGLVFGFVMWLFMVWQLSRARK